MKQYLLSLYHSDEYMPAPAAMDQIMKDVDALNSELQSEGAWVFAGGLRPASTATVVRVDGGGGFLTTDGPFIEGKEHIGGFWVIKAPDLDSALDWGRKATRACQLPVEVRPLHEEAEA